MGATHAKEEGGDDEEVLEPTCSSETSPTPAIPVPVRRTSTEIDGSQTRKDSLGHAGSTSESIMSPPTEAELRMRIITARTFSAPNSPGLVNDGLEVLSASGDFRRSRTTSVIALEDIISASLEPESKSPSPSTVSSQRGMIESNGERSAAAVDVVHENSSDQTPSPIKTHLPARLLMNTSSQEALDDLGLDDGDFGSADGKMVGFGEPSTPPGEYAQTMPDFQDTNPPPTLPPQLKKVTLNCEAVGNDSMDALPVPGHVILNHLYAQSVKQGVLVAGETTRYKKKYVTTVLIKPLPVHGAMVEMDQRDERGN